MQEFCPTQTEQLVLTGLKYGWCYLLKAHLIKVQVYYMFHNID